jgi:hypothetical protein
MNHPCQFAAFLSSVSVFGYGAHRMILRAHPDQKVIESMSNFYESAVPSIVIVAQAVFSPLRGKHYRLAGQKKLDLNQEFYACPARN